MFSDKMSRILKPLLCANFITLSYKGSVLMKVFLKGFFSLKIEDLVFAWSRVFYIYHENTEGKFS